MSLERDERHAVDLELLMERAIQGDKIAAGALLSKLVAAIVYAPERYQAHALSDSPDYPNEFFNLLCVKDKERVILPIFTRPELIQEWSGNELKYRSLPFREVLGLIPDEWWICLNPGMEVEKEFSAWEIAQLKLGPESIPEIIEELYADSEQLDYQLHQVGEEEYTALKHAVFELCATVSEVTRACLARETALDSEDKTLERLVLGIELSSANPERTTEIEQLLKTTAAQAQIGDTQVRVICGDAALHPALGVFRGFEPFYSRSSGAGLLVRNLLKFLRK